MPLSYAEKLLPNCLIDLMSTWNGQQSFAVNCSRATLGKTSKYSSGYGQCATVRGAEVMAAHRCMAAWPKGCLCMEGKLPPLGKQTSHLWKATATANMRERKPRIHFLTEDPLCAGRRLWAATTYLYHTKKMRRRASGQSVCRGSISLEKCTAVGMSTENW